jgi:hypothetical protein
MYSKIEEMKVLLFLNGFDGCQTGIEDGFRFILDSGKIKELEWFYFEDFAKKNTPIESRNKMFEIADKMQPNLIVFFHINRFKINDRFILGLKNLDSTPILVYDEGDMYGTWSKPITKSMKLIIKSVDVVSIRGLGRFYRKIHGYNSNIIYTPHHNDIARFDNVKNTILPRKKEIVFIGNRVKPKFLSFFRRLPGARGRENFVKKIGIIFKSKFKIYGLGWTGFDGNQGPIDFYLQNEIYKNSLITLAYEHYPNTPYYFSNRLPIALMNGSIYVCHKHDGYDIMFPNCDFIFFFNSINEAIDIMNYLFSLSDSELLTRSNNAKKFAERQYHPNIIWMNFFDNVIEKFNEKINS